MQRGKNRDVEILSVDRRSEMKRDEVLWSDALQISESKIIFGEFKSSAGKYGWVVSVADEQWL